MRQSPPHTFMVISRNDWDHQRWLEQCENADEQAKKPKAFQHRTMPTSKCSKCRLVVQSNGRNVCLATGRTVSEDTGLNECAFAPKVD